MLRNETEYLSDGQIFHGAIPLVMGTRLEMIAAGTHKETMNQLWGWVCVEAGSLDAVLDRFDPESEVSKVNASCAKPFVEVSGLLFSLVLLSKDIWKKTGGLFDVTKGGMKDVSLADSCRISLSGHGLDFGGLAKGYFLKKLSERLPSSGVTSAFVDFGGSSILAVGHHPFGDCWKVGVRNPFTDEVLEEIDLCGQSLSTSGNTPGYSSHIVDPLTGKPNEERKVVTVVSEDPLEAEILSTVLMVAGDAQRQHLKTLFPKALERIFLI